MYVSDGSIVSSSVKPAVWNAAGVRNQHPPSVSTVLGCDCGVGSVFCLGFDVKAGSVCSVVTDVLCCNGTHKATVLGTN